MVELDDLLEMLNVNGSNAEIIDAAVLAHNEAKQIMSEQNKPYKAVQDQAKARVELIIKQTGQTNWNELLQNGYAYMSASYPKVTYDWELLDKYLNDPNCPNDVKLVLMLARKETQVKSSLVIK